MHFLAIWQRRYFLTFREQEREAGSKYSPVISVAVFLERAKQTKKTNKKIKHIFRNIKNTGWIVIHMPSNQFTTWLARCCDEACVYGGSDLVAVFPEHLCCCTRIVASTRTLYSGEQEWLPCLEHIVIHRFKEKMLWVKKRSFHICNTQRPQTATTGYKMYCSKMICNFWTTHPFHMLQQVEWSGVSQCVRTFRRSIVNMFCCTIPKNKPTLSLPLGQCHK